jgi:hypothetical protein
LKAFGITDDPKYSVSHDYVWKGLVMMIGVYLFYLVEKILKIMILRKKVGKNIIDIIDLKKLFLNVIIKHLR